MKNAFCMILSRYKLYQGIALYQSLLYNTKDFKIYILCMDDDVYAICNQLNLYNAILVHVKDLENSSLTLMKNERALNEYCWTLKPIFIKYLLEQRNLGDHLTYTDADMCFFNDPAPIYEKNTEYTVMLSPHDFSKGSREIELICGKYNSGFIVFRNNKSSKKVLTWWQHKCMEWCYDRVDGGNFGDQKYLDLMPRSFEKIFRINTPGVNIAPWNEQKYNFRRRDGKVYINNHKLICYHFSGLRIIDKGKFALILGNKKVDELIYLPYIHILKDVIEKIEKIAPDFNGFYIEDKYRDSAVYFNI
ncbi:putative nucleotide-diphospho-sugar transferase [Geosporobacter ferrireducens]|uniref:putative nucleotide-diphospho-sugar transferase n=1 Tax=Geosporobacter ferrireducens TaxID=1424294 RepID=UPI00139DD793|nr:putative nucleotide-diphospho-sugar transferase [Geosporobacter ferrireducens]MTI55775.1 hypothetical protein [Geosporobacter ferrireducens]